MVPLSSNSNITLVAFHGEDKPKVLSQLLYAILAQIRTTLHQLDLPSTCFQPYTIAQIHGTLLGLEVIKQHGMLFNENFWKNQQDYQTIHPTQFFSFLAEYIQTHASLFTIRFGGFEPGHCTCTGASLDDWACQSSGSAFHAYQRSAYEGSFYAHAPGPAMLTGWPVQDATVTDIFPRSLYQFRQIGEPYGFLDRYHSARKPHWKNDDFYLRLGTFQDCAAPQFTHLIEQVRQFLAAKPSMTMEIHLQDLAIIYYDTPNFAKLRAKIPLVEALQNPQRIDALYRQWHAEH